MAILNPIIQQDISNNIYDFKYLRDYIQNLKISALIFFVPMNNCYIVKELLKTKFGKDFGSQTTNINNVDVLMDGQVQLSKQNGNTVQINGKYYTEWNPQLYKNEINDKQELYDFVINFIRYNANDQNSNTNQLNFAEFKHCRFQIYPKKYEMINGFKRTKQVFYNFGLGNDFQKLYQDN